MDRVILEHFIPHLDGRDVARMRLVSRHWKREMDSFLNSIQGTQARRKLLIRLILLKTGSALNKTISPNPLRSLSQTEQNNWLASILWFNHGVNLYEVFPENWNARSFICQFVCDDGIYGHDQQTIWAARDEITGDIIFANNYYDYATQCCRIEHEAAPGRHYWDRDVTHLACSPYQHIYEKLEAFNRVVGGNFFKNWRLIRFPTVKNHQKACKFGGKDFYRGCTVQVTISPGIVTEAAFSIQSNLLRRKKALPEQFQFVGRGNKRRLIHVASPANTIEQRLRNVIDQKSVHSRETMLRQSYRSIVVPHFVHIPDMREED